MDLCGWCVDGVWILRGYCVDVWILCGYCLDGVWICVDTVWILCGHCVDRTNGVWIVIVDSVWRTA